MEQFNWLSWTVIVVYIIFTTWLGAVLSGKQATIKDFFLGGRKLPWYAVSGSIIATELSAMTLVGAPAFLWAETGNMTYAVLALGGLVSRLLVGYFFIPKYYEREIYSPYEYIGNQLGQRANSVTSALFMIGGVLGQGTRVLMTAIVLQVVTGLDIYYSIWIVGAVAVLWTFLGGITTVIWTDVIQFVLFAFTAVFIFFVVVGEYISPTGETGWVPIAALASAADKFKWLNTDFDMRESYTIWSALIGSSIGGLVSYGLDQMMAQRIFCCKGPREARLAVITSWASQFLMVACLFTGVALWAYYRNNGMPGVPNAEEAAKIAEDPNRLVPVFIKFRIHPAIGGLMVAGIFAAAISSLDSILAALSQQTLAFVRRRRARSGSEGREIWLSRAYILVWGIVLCGMASIFQMVWAGEGLIIELALAVVSLTQGAILGAFLLAFFPAFRRSARGMEWAAALSVLTIFALMQHGGAALRAPFNFDLTFDFDAGLKTITAQVWPFASLLIAGLIVLITGAVFRMKQDPFVIPKLLLFLIPIFFLNIFQYQTDAGPEYLKVGWPWYTPIGGTVMLLASLMLCDRSPGLSAEPAVAGEDISGAEPA